MSTTYQKLSNIYNEMLKTDVKEYEESSRRERLQKLDQMVQEAVKLELDEAGEDLGVVGRRGLDMFASLDKYLGDSGLPIFQTFDRLSKARAFFDAKPEQLKPYFGMYQEARAEAWEST